MIAFLLTAAGIAQSANAVATTNPPRASTQFQIDAAFTDNKSGQWSSGDRPSFSSLPTAAEIFRVAGIPSSGFGVSFSCRVMADNRLDDCQFPFASPNASDSQKLMNAIRPLLLLKDASTKIARKKSYRVMVRAAVTEFDAQGAPTQCNPPFCIADDLRAPPSPPLPKNTVKSTAIEK